MYVGKRYDATHSDLFTIEFNCPLCGHSRDAEVLGKGYGGAESPFFMNNAGAEADAREAAWSSAARNARHLIKLARCPKCHRRSARRVLGFLLFALLATPLPGALFVALGAWFYGRREQGYGLMFMGVGLVLTLGIYFTVIHPKWAGVSRKIRFLEEEEMHPGRPEN